jgi:hypothetical protein
MTYCACNWIDGENYFYLHVPHTRCKNKIDVCEQVHLRITSLRDVIGAMIADPEKKISNQIPPVAQVERRQQIAIKPSIPPPDQSSHLGQWVVPDYAIGRALHVQRQVGVVPS